MSDYMISDADVDDLIERSFWQAYPGLGSFVGGHGTPGERRTALMTALRERGIDQAAMAAQVALSLAERPMLERIESELLQLATARHALDPGRTIGSHLFEIGRALLRIATASAGRVDGP